MNVKGAVVNIGAIFLALGVFCGQVFSATITYTYDDLHRLMKVDYGDGTVIEYTYDAAGNRLIQAVPNRPPVLDSIGSKSGNEGSALTFTVRGSDLDENPLAFSATNLPAGATFDATSHTFSWTPSFTQAGVYSVTFTVSDGSLTASEVVSITVNEGLPVTSASPNAVTYGITTSRSITVYGTGFALGARITVGSLSGVTVAGSTASTTAPFVFTSSSQVKFYWPTTYLPPGTYDIQVTNPDGTAGTLTGGFTVAAPQPTLSSISRPSVTYAITSSASITIYGSNFVSGATISVDGVSGMTVPGSIATSTSPFVFVSNSQLKFYWANTAIPLGAYAVTVTNPTVAGGLSASLADAFTVLPPAPTVTSASPSPVIYGVSPSRSITVYGSNFIVGATLSVGSLSGTTVAGSIATVATPFVLVSSSRLSVYWANTSLAPDTYNIQVMNPATAGGLSATLASAFIVIPPQPSVSSLNPASVTYGVSNASSVTVYGSNFLVGSIITVGSLSGTTVAGSIATAATPFVVTSNSQVKFYWPNTSLLPGAYAVTVGNPSAAGGLSASLAGGFAVIAPQPAISSISYASVTYGVTASRAITIYGSNFVPGGTITVGGLSGTMVAGSTATTATPFVFVTSSRLSFYWPNTALPPAAYAVQVTNPAAAGGLSATLANGFTVAAPQPVATSVSPTPVTYGTTSSGSITIYGSNFLVGATITVGSLTGTTVAGSTATATTPFVYVSGSQLKFYWGNSSLPVGSYVVGVTNPTAAGGGTGSLIAGFVVQ